MPCAPIHALRIRFVVLLAAARRYWFPMRRGRAGTLLAVAAIVLAACAAQATPTATPQADPSARAEQALTGLHLTPRVTGSSLIATMAFADLGVDVGLGSVRVRIVDTLSLAVELKADQDVVFAERPKVCLVGPFSAPDDAGLSDPCWGEPDLASAMAQVMPTDPGGRPMLRAGDGVSVALDLRRGEARCDYPPGGWVVEIKANPVIDGTPMGARYLDDVPFEIPFATSGPLPLVVQNRYCGLASVIVREQGEPEVQTP